MQTIRLAFLIAFGLGTPAMAAGTVPEEYQGVWAAARDCKENFQNVLSNVVNREFAACRVMQVLSSGHPESHTSTIYLNCGGPQPREIWHSENIDGTDYLVIIQFEQAAEAGDPRLTCISGALRYRLARYRSAKFPAVRSQIRRPKKKSPHHRAAFKLRASAHFHIPEQPAYGSTALNKNKRAASAGELARYEPQQQKSGRQFGLIILH